MATRLTSKCLLLSSLRRSLTSTRVQTNYFRKGDSTTTGRGGIHSATGVDTEFLTYTVDWTSTEIVWQVNGVTQRVLTASAAGDQYPQSPMRLKIGVWSGGDSSNAAGTIAWAGGTTNYADGPFTMVVQSVSVSDYSTGTSYSYSGTSGDWTSIKAAGGSVNGGPDTVDTAAPAITSTVSGAVPWDGTHRDTTSTYVTPSVWPWVATGTATTLETTTTANAQYTVNASGKVIPLSAAANGKNKFHIKVPITNAYVSRHFLAPITSGRQQFHSWADPWILI